MKETNLKEEAIKINSLPSGADTSSDNNRDSKPLSALNRQLTEDDLKAAGVRKLLLGQMDEFENCKKELDQYKTKYHERDKESAVLTTKLHAYISFDWIYSILLTTGSILVGYYASQPDCGYILIIIGVLCILAAIGFKIWHNYENKVQ